MTMNKRKYLFVFWIVVILFTLVACGIFSADSGEEPPPPVMVEGSETEESLDASPEEGITPTEAAAVGAFGVLAVSLIRRQLSWDGFVKSLYETLRTSCMVMFLIAGAAVFGKFLAVTRIPFNIASGVGGLDLPPYLILGVVILVYLIGGCIMDALALVMLTIPIFYPLVIDQLAYDPIWFGVIIVLITQMGVITPPVGINVYVVYGVSQGAVGGIPLESIFKGIVPFLVAIAVGIVLMIIFPTIITWLPNLMY